MILDRLVGKITIVILSFRVSTFKNKKISTIKFMDERHLFALWISDLKYTKFLFITQFIVIKKKNIILEEKWIVKKYIFIYEISIIIILICQRLGSFGPTQQQNKLSLPNKILTETFNENRYIKTMKESNNTKNWWVKRRCN